MGIEASVCVCTVQRKVGEKYRSYSTVWQRKGEEGENWWRGRRRAKGGTEEGEGARETDSANFFQLPQKGKRSTESKKKEREKKKKERKKNLLFLYASFCQRRSK